MTIIGVGTDIVEIERISRSCKREAFLNKVFSQNERAFLENKNPYPSLAANWAGKEAFAKAVGTGVRGFELCEVEILRNKLGKPYIKLSGKAFQLFGRLKFEISLSHSKDYATAVVIAVK